LCCEFGYVVSFHSFSSKGDKKNYDSPFNFSNSFHICLISILLRSFLILQSA